MSKSLSTALSLIALMFTLVLVTGCGDKEREHKDDDHGHSHTAGGHHHDGGPHHGVVAHLEDGVGYLELKLHDDKGDLEIWLNEDEKGTAPIDLPLDTTIIVTFLDKDDKQVTLKVRNTEKNEDEDGLPNIRDGKTNYFIFPGDTGADATWLQGKAFHARVVVAFKKGGKQVKSEPFDLTPHSH